MDKMPDEILMKIFSYLEVQDLGRCAMVSKRFHEMAYERRLWHKLPINLFNKDSGLFRAENRWVQFMSNCCNRTQIAPVD